MTTTPIEQSVNCSFCGKRQDAVVRLVAGPGVYICNECVDLANQILVAELKQLDEPPALKAWDELSDEQLLAEMVKAHAAHQNVDRGVAQHVAALRARGVSWARIGDALGMTRQSAWERFSGED